MTYGVFEAASGSPDYERKRLAKTRLSQATAKAEESFGQFLFQAKTRSDFEGALDLVESDLRNITAQYLHGDTGVEAVKENLRTLFKEKSAHKKTADDWKKDTEFQHFLVDQYGTTDVSNDQLIEALEAYAGVGSGEGLEEEKEEQADESFSEDGEGPEIHHLSSRHIKSSLEVEHGKTKYPFSGSDFKGLAEQLQGQMQSLASGDSAEFSFELGGVPIEGSLAIDSRKSTGQGPHVWRANVVINGERVPTSGSMGSLAFSLTDALKPAIEGVNETLGINRDDYQSGAMVGGSPDELAQGASSDVETKPLKVKLKSLKRTPKAVGTDNKEASDAEREKNLQARRDAKSEWENTSTEDKVKAVGADLGSLEEEYRDYINDNMEAVRSSVQKALSSGSGTIETPGGTYEYLPGSAGDYSRLKWGPYPSDDKVVRGSDAETIARFLFAKEFKDANESLERALPFNEIGNLPWGSDWFNTQEALSFGTKPELFDTKSDSPGSGSSKADENDSTEEETSGQELPGEWKPLKGSPGSFRYDIDGAGAGGVFKNRTGPGYRVTVPSTPGDPGSESIGLGTFDTLEEGKSALVGRLKDMFEEHPSKNPNYSKERMRKLHEINTSDDLPEAPGEGQLTTKDTRKLAEYLTTEEGKKLFRKVRAEELYDGLDRDSATSMALMSSAAECGIDSDAINWTDYDFDARSIVRAKYPRAIENQLNRVLDPINPDSGKSHSETKRDKADADQKAVDSGEKMRKPSKGETIKGTAKDGKEYEGEMVKMVFGRPKIKTSDGTEITLTKWSSRAASSEGLSGNPLGLQDYLDFCDEEGFEPTDDGAFEAYSDELPGEDLTAISTWIEGQKND